MKRAVLLAAAALTLTAGCGTGSLGDISGSQDAGTASSPDASLANAYLATGTGWVNYLQWNSSGSGSFTNDRLAGATPDEQVSSVQTSLTVYVNGNEITFTGLTPQNGTLSNGQLTLQVLQSDGTLATVTFTPATQDQFNAAVQVLQNQAAGDDSAEQQAEQQAAVASASAQAQASQAAASAQAQQSLANDVSVLVSDTAALNNDTSLGQDVNTMKSDYQQEQADWQTEQNTACSTNEVGGYADTVGGDADTVGGGLDTLNGAVTTLQNGGIPAVQNDMSAIAGDVTTLQNLGAAPGTPSSAAITAGNNALTSTASAISWANGQGQTVYGDAQALATTAQNFAAKCG